MTISIHALLAESDPSSLTTADCPSIFLSTLSLRRATCMILTPRFCVLTFLSTLSLRRATVATVLAVGRAGYFYPRSPCGERPILTLIPAMAHLFLSTLSLRRATLAVQLGCRSSLKFLSTLSLRRATLCQF